MTLSPPRPLRLCSGPLLAAALATGPAQAQTSPFDARMTEALAEAGNRAWLIECLALFRTFRLFAGSNTEAGRVAGERENDMAVIATIVWQGETGTGMEAAMDEILPLSDAATEIFVDRFTTNRETTGTVFDDDVSDRLGECNAIRGQLMEALE